MQMNSVDIPRVLIVEDDPAYQRLLEIYIQRAGGHCECTSDGRVALNMAAENDYDLMLIDIHVPNLDGIMLVKLLRDRGSEVPLIAMTALKLENLEQNALTVGFNDYLQKPITEAEISSLFEKYGGSKATHTLPDPHRSF